MKPQTTWIHGCSLAVSTGSRAEKKCIGIGSWVACIVARHRDPYYVHCPAQAELHEHKYAAAWVTASARNTSAACPASDLTYTLVSPADTYPMLSRLMCNPPCCYCCQLPACRRKTSVATNAAASTSQRQRATVAVSMSHSEGGSCDRKAFFSEIARGAAGLGLAAAVAPTMAAAKEVCMTQLDVLLLVFVSRLGVLDFPFCWCSS